ncbi:type II toxin-antitoxin system VapB family antitoxin [Actinoplanes sp. NPDC024001]|uniref:type II toxin-antitoxin system VapB family antitoxin n=1 Tax=Actinoplanes sp. NPDC024001 TaxID=3154598 RepID=UPI0033E24D65
MEAVVAEHRINVDDEALTTAAEILGTSGTQDTVNAALREVIAVRRRLEAFERLGEMGAAGAFDDLADKRNYRR